MTDHAELRRVAALAHPDAEWFIARNLDHPNIDKPAASFIATANPKTVLALLDEIDRLKTENEALLLGMRAILNAYDYADQYNKEGVAVEVMEDLRTLFKGATQ
ncbi:ead/Ea22-like family protein [Pseudomonas aeruginosa]|uniref:ead/Ea22-like family protein n=1 Tax=Pseudomonas aeruginosa TaxID=287 RepID=UPI0035F5629A